MFRRKRRKARVIWLPNVGEPNWGNVAGDAIGNQPGYIDSAFSITTGGGRTPTAEFPLFKDGPNRQDTQGVGAVGIANLARSPLNELIEWGYLLRRIVGTINVSVATIVQDQTQVPPALAGLVCTAAIIVRRTDDADGSTAFLGSSINTQDEENVRDPWIWRRSWCLLNSSLGVIAGSDPVGIGEDADCIISESVYSPVAMGDIRSGPHVDAKTRRVVGPEERVFLDVSFRERNIAATVPTDWQAHVFFDYRGLATLRQNSGNKRNSSR